MCLSMSNFIKIYLIFCTLQSMTPESRLSIPRKLAYWLSDSGSGLPQSPWTRRYSPPRFHPVPGGHKTHNEAQHASRHRSDTPSNRPGGVRTRQKLGNAQTTRSTLCLETPGADSGPASASFGHRIRAK